MTTSPRTRYLAVLLFGLTILNIWVYFKPLGPVVVEIPSVDKTIGIHDKHYENAWIQFVENGMVQVQTAETKTAMVFRPDINDLKRFRIGNIAPVTFECDKKPGEECDLSRPYKLYVSSVRVELVEIKKMVH